MPKKILLLIFLSICADIPVLTAAPSDTCNQAKLCTNGEVRAILPSGNTVYIGGSFTQVGAYSGGAVPLDYSTGLPPSTFPKIQGTVYAVCADGYGGWFVGGSFSSVSGLPRSNIARITAGGIVDPAWNPDADSTVNALYLSGTIVYVGGKFISIGNESRRNLAALDIATGITTSWNPNPNGLVTSFALSATTLFLGGNFDSIGGVYRAGFAAINTATGSTLPLDIPIRGIKSMALSGTSLYIGGGFGSIGPETRRNVGAVNIGIGTILPWNPDADKDVYCIIVSGTTVFVGGAFDTVNAQVRRHIAAIDIATGNALSWTAPTDSAVLSIVASGTTLYAGGRFKNIRNTARNRLAALRADSGYVLAWNPNAGDAVHALAVNSAIVFAGGEFTIIGGQARNRLAAFNALTGNVLPWNPNANGPVMALVKSGNKVFAGGNFTTINVGYLRQNIAALDTGTGNATSLSANPNGTVWSLAVSGATLYAGGSFSSIGATSRNCIAAINVDDGSVREWNPNANKTVRSIAVHGTRVLIGGGFDSIGGKLQPFLAAVDSASGNALSWNPALNDSVYTLAVNGATLYAGGAFTSAGGQNRLYVAAIDTEARVLPWNPRTNGGWVYSIAANNSTVFAGGSKTIPDPTLHRIAAIHSTTGNALTWNPDADKGIIYSLALSGTTLYAGGAFPSIGKGIGQSYFAQFGAFLPFPDIASVVPSSAVNKTVVLITGLHGTNFLPGSIVKFVKAGQPARDATNVSVASSSQITCSVDMTDAEAGLWGIVVTNEEQKSDTLGQCFTVLSRAPDPIVPDDNASGISLTPTLSWHTKYDDSLYTLQLSASPEFSLRIVNNPLVTDSSVTLPQALLSNGTTYFWKVAATKKGGELTEFSAIRKFSTVSLPNQVSLLSPSPGEALQADSTLLRWTKPSLGADRYCVEIFIDSLLNGRLSIDSSITDTLHPLKGLTNRTSYWWRVSAHNAAGWGTASETRKFTIAIPSVAVLPNNYSCLMHSLSKSGSLVQYALPGPSEVIVNVYDISGRLIKVVVRSRQQAGYHQIHLNNRGLPKGYVVLVFMAGTFKKIQSMLIF